MVRLWVSVTNLEPPSPPFFPSHPEPSTQKRASVAPKKARLHHGARKKQKSPPWQIQLRTRKKIVFRPLLTQATEPKGGWFGEESGFFLKTLGFPHPPREKVPRLRWRKLSPFALAAAVSMLKAFFDAPKAFCTRIGPCEHVQRVSWSSAARASMAHGGVFPPGHIVSLLGRL